MLVFAFSIPAFFLLHASFKFKKKSYLEPSRLWPTVYDEQRAIAGIIPLLRSDWSLPWCKQVYCSDASEKGYAFASRMAPSHLVAECGRVLERSRYKSDDAAHQARLHAFAAFGLLGLSRGKAEDYLQLSSQLLHETFKASL